MIKKTYALGLDLGGTHIKAAVVTADGIILEQLQVETPPDREITNVARKLVEIGSKLVETWQDIKTIGVGAPGLVDRGRQKIRIAPNFPTWRNAPLRDMIEEKIQRPVLLENDVNCFGLAEHRWGSGRGFQNVLALTVGTGIGGAIILDGNLYRGDSGAAAELGHISVDLWGPKCNCGNRGCIERYLGKTWFIEAAREALDNENISSPKEVDQMAESGNRKALEFIEGRGEILGVACTTLIHIFDPQVIVIGGGIAQAGEPFFKGIRKAIKERAYKILAEKVKILPAELGTIAGAMGAAALGLNETK